MIKIFNLNIFIRDFSLTVKRETFNLRDKGSNPLSLISLRLIKILLR